MRQIVIVGFNLMILAPGSGYLLSQSPSPVLFPNCLSVSYSTCEVSHRLVPHSEGFIEFLWKRIKARKLFITACGKIVNISANKFVLRNRDNGRNMARR